ncbi:MAG TPA: fumarylacetoacetate hydrolase family protein [Steroidobacteraceae bacterium]|jgi:2-keto-4-pentenoate hydratase/2-oxohepta-3-ene-1,7-dioic acid hydratase in catechol pathway|nr:fumarylacetoacetate hydrolase family protein [Steroidobacteraceae bacterium]
MSHWARFRTADRVGFGILEDNRLLEHEGDMFAVARPTERHLNAGEFTLLAPCAPSKIVALWNNFHALAAKIGKAAPSHPLFFLKSATSAIGPLEPIRRPASYGGKIVFEGELGIVIGKATREVSAAQARDHIFGYTCVNDVTAIDLLFENGDFPQWGRSKSFDTFGCLGPVIATEFDSAKSHVITRLDGAERQNYPLSDMIFPPHELVSLISHDLLLLPGDVIACGTSIGVGSIKDGVTVDVSIAGIGSLQNRLAG